MPAESHFQASNAAKSVYLLGLENYHLPRSLSDEALRVD
jgi:hypothetical protein